MSERHKYENVDGIYGKSIEGYGNAWRYQVAHSGVTEIRYRSDYYGDHRSNWFDVYEGERLIASANEKYVETITYGN